MVPNSKTSANFMLTVFEIKLKQISLVILEIIGQLIILHPRDTPVRKIIIR